MGKRILTAIRPGLACLVITSLLLTGCSAARSADEPLAETKAAEAAEATEEARAEQGAGLENALDNLAELAPVHVRSSYVARQGDEVTEQTEYEADLDAMGNQHVVIHSEDGDVLELYVVDRILYFGSEGDQFVSVGEMEEDSPFAVVAAYGADYLLAFNDLENAEKVGSETVNGFQTDKYEFKLDLGEMGLASLAAGAEGGQFDYQAYAWIEPASGALVRSQVDWTVKDPDEAVAETFHSEFDATKGTVAEIEAPENVVSFGG